MQQSTGQVSTDRVFGPGGRYGLGVDYKFKAFPSDAHFIALNDVAVFARDGPEVHMDVQFQYFIRPFELQMLHDEYDLQYNGIVRGQAETIIKQVAPNFTTDEFYEKREEVEQRLAGRLFSALAGAGCCDSYCSGELRSDGYIIPSINCSGCVQECTANNTDRLFVDVR